MPTMLVKLRTSVPIGLVVQGRDEWCVGAPHRGRAEELAVREFPRLTEAVEHEAKVVATMAPYLLQPSQRKTRGFIETHRSPDSDVGDVITPAAGLAENVRVLMARERMSRGIQSGEDR